MSQMLQFFRKWLEANEIYNYTQQKFELSKVHQILTAPQVWKILMVNVIRDKTLYLRNDKNDSYSHKN